MTAELTGETVALAGDLDIDQLLMALSELREQLRFVWTESPSSAQLMTWEPDLDGPNEVRQSQSGRAFGVMCEVRWLRRDERFRVVVTTSGPKPSHPFPRTLDLGPCVAEATGYPLWGYYDADDEGWREERIPGTLRYPVAGAPEQVMLDTIGYRDSDSGEVVMFRLAGVRGVDG